MRVSHFFFFFPSHCVCWNVVIWNCCFIGGEIQIHNIFKNPYSPTIHLESRNIKWPKVNGCLILLLFNMCFCCPFCVSCVVSCWLPCPKYVWLQFDKQFNHISRERNLAFSHARNHVQMFVHVKSLFLYAFQFILPLPLVPLIN